VKNLLGALLVITPVTIFAFSKRFEFSKNDKHVKASLNLMVGSICYDKDKDIFVMRSYFGGNRKEEFYNSCAIVEYRLNCLGKIARSRRIYNKKFCVEPMKFKVVNEKVLFRSFSDKFECKRRFEKLEYKTRNSLSSLKCYFTKEGSTIDDILYIDEKKQK
jgi:hypothetical protein